MGAEYEPSVQTLSTPTSTGLNQELEQTIEAVESAETNSSQHEPKPTTPIQLIAEDVPENMVDRKVSAPIELATPTTTSKRPSIQTTTGEIHKRTDEPKSEPNGGLTAVLPKIDVKIDIENNCGVQGLIIKNIPDEMTVDALEEVIGNTATSYLKNLCSCKITEGEGQGRLAIITAPHYHAKEILKLNNAQIQMHKASISSIELEFLELKIHYPHTNEECVTENKILEFVVSNIPADNALSRCVILSNIKDDNNNSSEIHAVIATTLKSENGDLCDGIRKISGHDYYEILKENYAVKQQKMTVRRRPSPSIVKEPDISAIKGKGESTSDTLQLIHEIRNYSMNVCKQMKNKLNYLDREHFKIRQDKGSVSKEQLYIDCNTAIYEYLRFYMVNILKEKMNCTEDMKRRKFITDSELNSRSEVEAQHSISFVYDNTQYKVHLTFYYTKCSIWVQGSSSKINNLTVAQFFTFHYIEKITNTISENVALDDIGQTLRRRILEFLDGEEKRQLEGSVEPRAEHKCPTCDKKCHENGKSMACCKCQQKQHFRCANIRSEDERSMYLTGKESFICGKCLPSYQIDGGLIDGAPLKEDKVSTPETLKVNAPQTIAPECTQNVDQAKQEQIRPKSIQLEENRDSLGETNQNADKILIRRLQGEMNKMVEEHTKKESEMNEEIARIKEAYRICMANYEKEKDTKETLQECLKALQAKDATDSVAGQRQRSRGKQANNEEQHITSVSVSANGVDAPRSTSKQCRFYNRKSGCAKGSQCTFEHLEMPACNYPNCNGNECILDHKQQSPMRSENTSNTPNKPKKKACWFFNRQSGCLKGDQCTFEHILMPPCNKPNCNSKHCELSHKSKSLNENSTEKVNVPCKFVNTRKGCIKGKNCRFLHNENENSDQSQHQGTKHFLSKNLSSKSPDPDKPLEELMRTIQSMIQHQICQVVGKISTPNNMAVTSQVQMDPTLHQTQSTVANNHSANHYQQMNAQIPGFYPQGMKVPGNNMISCDQNQTQGNQLNQGQAPQMMYYSQT